MNSDCSRTATFMLPVLFLATSTSLMAQARPNFSGRWTIDAPKSTTSGGGVMGGLNGFIEITQDDDTMRIVVPKGIYQYPFYRFDGIAVTGKKTWPYVKSGRSAYRSHGTRGRLITTIIEGEHKGETETLYMDGDEIVQFLRASPGGGWWKTYWKRVSQNTAASGRSSAQSP